MKKMDKDLINDYRAVVLPVLQNILIKRNFEGRGLSDALEIEKDFNELLRLAEKALDSQWIPIKTRELTEEEKEEYPDCTFMYDCKLPEDGEEVLVTTWLGDTALDTFCRDDGCYFENYCDEGDVIAWMPKPESYKKEGTEE